ncbi:DUF1823 family protein [Prochlorococcus sp. MIT 1300]|uniref:DUF1823 family protein n=1 Tax=Prochlorococcus sp. MIT 1300 TaxID=3096218 RepID=UPI002A75B806|nr:DUF1823 family protein [Prochlorococcus sp. MIT 1300]
MTSFLNENESSFWPLSKTLLKGILDDQITDSFVVQLVWERLGYLPINGIVKVWHAGPTTPEKWALAFPEAPEVIVGRRASVHLTRSIPKEHKQLLKQSLNFAGYRIGELYPRRTRRATVVNWLLAWLVQEGQELLEEGPMPKIFPPPSNPLQGHPGDPLVQ